MLFCLFLSSNLYWYDTMYRYFELVYVKENFLYLTDEVVGNYHELGWSWLTVRTSGNQIWPMFLHFSCKSVVNRLLEFSFHFLWLSVARRCCLTADWYRAAHLQALNAPTTHDYNREHFVCSVTWLCTMRLVAQSLK